MKKFLTLALAIVMVLTLSVNVFAEAQTNSSLGTAAGSTTKPTTSDEIPVTINTITTTADTVYRVDVEWESLTFTYTFGNDGDWNPTTHLYENPVSDGWDKTTTTFSVNNHSNTAVNVTVACTNAANNETGVTAAIEGDTTGTLDMAAVGSNFGDAPSKEFTVKITGTPDPEDNGATIANITVTLN